MRRKEVQKGLAAAAVAVGVLSGPASIAAAAPNPAADSGGRVRLAQIEWGCSIGFGGTDRTGAAVIVTAGHCAPRGARLGTPAFLGQDNVATGRLVAHSSIDSLDYAAIRLVPGIHVSSSLIGPPPRRGDIVCKTGRITGRTCGTVTNVTAASITVSGIRVAWGDSGAGLRDAQGRIIGIASRGQVSGVDGQLRAITGMVGLGDPVPTLFPRADAIVAALGRQVGFTVSATETGR